VSTDPKKLLEQEIDKLLSFLQKSYKARVKWVRQGKYDQVIASELSSCLSNGRLDLVENLIDRRHNIIEFLRLIDQVDYENRFGQNVEHPPLPNGNEIKEIDSTQKE